MKEIRLGSIGSGVIVHSIMNNVQRTDGIRLEAVYSRTEQKGRELADEYGVKKVYTDMDDLFGDKDIDFIYIATPNTLHYEQVKRALSAGKNVICEKPFATTAAKAKELVALAKEKGLILVDATPTFFLPNLAIIKRELSKIGRVKLVMANYSQYSSRYDQLLKGEMTNIFNPEFGGGSLMDINYYNIYLTTALFGEPAEVSYLANLFDGKVDTSGIVSMKYDGFSVSLCGAKDTFGVNYYQIEGEKGYIYAKDGSNGLATVEVVTKEGSNTYNDQPDPDRWYYEVQNITKTLLSEDSDTIAENNKVMLNAVTVLEKARKSAGITFPED